MSGYIGINGKAKGISDIYVGVNGKAKKVVAGFVGDENGKAQQIYSSEKPIFKFTVNSYAAFKVMGKNLLVDYGDGNTATVDNTSEYVTCDHNYNGGTHQVTITGQIWGLRFDVSVHADKLLSVDTIFPRNNKISFADDMFAGCSSLSTIPSGLFEYVNTATYSYTFAGCTALTTIPSNLFPRGFDFLSTFRGCSGLTSIPDGLFPESAITFTQTFYECTSLTGNAPELWDTTQYPFEDGHYQCFYGCTGLSNYADIPSDWK